MTLEDVKRHYERIGKPLPSHMAAELGGTEDHARASRRKYGNNPTEYRGKVYDSTKEARRAQELDILQTAGEIAGWQGQVPFLLPGGIRYFADFVVLELNGTYRVEDVKSEITRKDKVYRLKRRQMRECLGIDIVEV